MATFTILEPMSTGDVIDRAVRLYRRNFTPLLQITAVPTVLGWVVSVMFWNGYTSVLTSASTSRGFSVTALVMLILGLLGYPVWMFVTLSTVSGLCRVVGDHVMLGDPITFRGCFAAVRKRLGAITLMGLLSVALLFAAYLVVSIVLFVGFLLFALIVGAIAEARMPQWVTTVILTVTAIAAVAGALLLIFVVASRLIFLPQVVMIEGESAGNALGRAIRLGKGNWYRVAAIVLFTYFVSFSILAALTLPVLVVLYISGLVNTEFFVGSTWNILYTSFGQISNLLSLPIWIVSFTLLYFDSRVRKEAYDVDLLAREINPGFYWQPPVLQSVPGNQIPPQVAAERTYVQSGPLGLAGYRPPSQPVAEVLPEAPSTSTPPEPQDLRERFEQAAKHLSAKEPTDSESPERERGPDEITKALCVGCGASLLEGARFCMTCGRST